MQNSRLILRQLRGGDRNVIVSDRHVKGSSGTLNSAVISSQFFRLFHATEICSSKSPSTPEAKESSKDGTTKRIKTPIGKLDELPEGKHPYQEKEPLPAWPDNTNPHTGEVGGPRGPEPTRYGDWERKGRVTDF